LEISDHTEQLEPTCLKLNFAFRRISNENATLRLMEENIIDMPNEHKSLQFKNKELQFKLDESMNEIEL